MPSITPRDRARRRVATGAVLAGLVVAAFEGTVVAPAMPTIVRDLGGLSAYAWVFSAFLVASTVAVLVCGALADAVGRLPVFAAGVGLFLVGSTLCGTATSFEGLVAFRIVQGLGAGAIQPIAMTITADLYTLEERARIQALFTGAWGSASLVGPLLGGWIVLHASWRWVFLVNVPVGAVAILLLVASYRDPPRTSAVARLSSYLAQWRSMLAAPAVVAGLACSLFAGGILAACSAYVPLWMATQRSGNALAAGGALIPLLVGWAFGSSFGVRVLVAKGMRTSVGGGFLVGLVGAVGLAFAVVTELPTVVALAALGVLGLGLGPAASTSLVGPQSCVPWKSRGAVTSALYGARMLGGAVAVWAIGAVGEGSRVGDRFVAIGLVALGGLLAAALLAPRVLRAVEDDAVAAG